MKKLIPLILALCTVLGGCQKFDDSEIWDNINSLDERLTALEKMCREMNTNIGSLQALVTALQENDYVTGVTPIMEGGKQLGYAMKFSKSGNIIIYHGESANLPIVAIRKGDDGIYYWTINGNWLLDESDNKIPTTGKDSTPQLRIIDGYWEISYDKGLKWSRLCQAIGYSCFRSVTETDRNVIVVLADGSEIKLPKSHQLAVELMFREVAGFTATFEGAVIRKSLDLKVTVYYSTVSNLTIYKNKGKVSVTEFDGDTFALKLTGLAAETTYYYFTEIISNGAVTYSEVSSFRTGKADSYVDWEEGENIGGEI